MEICSTLLRNFVVGVRNWLSVFFLFVRVYEIDLVMELVVG